MYKNPDEVAYRPQVLAGVVGVLIAVSQSTENSAIPPDERPLDIYKDVLLGAVTSGLKQANTRRPALEGSYHLVRISGLLTTEEIGYLTHTINELISESSSDLDDLRSVPDLQIVLISISLMCTY